MTNPDDRLETVMHHEHHDITASSSAAEYNHNVTPFLHHRLVGRIAAENYMKNCLIYANTQSPYYSSYSTTNWTLSSSAFSLATKPDSIAIIVFLIVLTICVDLLLP